MKRFSFFKEVYASLASKDKKSTLFVDYLNPQRLFTVKRLSVLFLVTYGGFSYFTLKDSNPQYSLKLSTSRKISKISGQASQMYIPESLRKPLFSLYSKVYAVKLDEIENDISSFETFSKFFTRTIKPRPIDPQPLSLASPADSRILTFSEVQGDEVMIVKGIEYKLGELLTGLDTYQIKGEVLKSMKRNPENRIYQIILYLAPGDYHRFHSPADCTFKTRNHVVGELVPVKETYVKTHSGVYEKNERVSIFGDWIKGMMCMVFVGALNVGTIDLVFDDSLKTNKKLHLPFKMTEVKFYTGEKTIEDTPENIIANVQNSESVNPKGISVKKGEEVGKFNLGSTIVLVFEASPDFEWKVQPGQAVQYGQCIGVSK